ncbi:peroxiredoxin-like family protein [Persicobacter sp. CCB-QB2]|uniref:peroxiredoxin-like family protein n=1 Tax=Persicobacter sp. CCB-QB2 TaxID=1561025 RepID=UPI0006A9B9AD|nr:peroxiredoxin-like family protein [Persicobacter sp. CCB-QB2]
MKTFAIALLLILSPLFIFAQGGLKVGDSAPSFSATDQNGKLIRSEDVLAKGDMVLVFYRGTWCPHCRRHISNLQKDLLQITEKGANVVVVTPEQPEFIEKMVKKSGATFSILHDTSYKIMLDYKVAFKLGREIVPASFKQMQKNARKHNGNLEDMLPVPATYIISRDGNIRYIHYNPDFTERAGVEEIAAQLVNL